jgi:hypothetical protein
MGEMGSISLLGEIEKGKSSHETSLQPSPVQNDRSDSYDLVRQGAGVSAEGAKAITQGRKSVEIERR